MLNKLRTWAVDRFGLREIGETMLFRRVPKTSWYQGDGAALMLLLGTLVVTGMFMTPTYSPTPETAYESVRYITDEQLMGWLVRALHYWSAGLFVVMVFFHLFRLILIGGYKFPREGTWLVGVVMFFLVMTMGFTGYVLRWDERGLYALKVAMTMFWRVPWIGDDLVVFIQGGEEITGRTLTRVYAVHVVFVPMLLVGLAGYHLFLVIVRGVTSKAERGVPLHTAEEQKELYHRTEQTEGESEVFHPETTAKSGGMAFVVFLLVVGLSLWLGPQDLEPEARTVGQPFPQEEWYFWWYSGLIALLPAWVAPWFVVLFPVAVFVALVALPFVDRGPYRGMRKRPVAVVTVLVLVAALLFLTDLRRRSAWTGWPRAEPPPIPADAEPLSAVAERGRQAFAMHGCGSCHAIAGAGAKVGPDLARLDPLRPKAWMRDYVLQPPPGVAMPAYRGRISEDDLNDVVEFVLVAQTFGRSQKEASP